MNVGSPAARFGPLLCLAVLAFGCASTPQATHERDAEAKEFVTHPATGAIYVYRHALDRLRPDSVLFADRRIVGATLPGGFFRIDLNPGKRVLHGTGHDTGSLEIDVRPGQVYFVFLRVVEGTSYFLLRPEAVGRAELLRCCVLLENWAPGQRPLLR